MLIYFQGILQEHRQAEKELIRNRMPRVSHNMPDTLYMIEPQKRSNTAPALFLSALGAGRLEREERPSTSQSSRREENELDRYVRSRRTGEIPSGTTAMSLKNTVHFARDYLFQEVRFGIVPRSVFLPKSRVKYLRTSLSVRGRRSKGRGKWEFGRARREGKEPSFLPPLA